MRAPGFYWVRDHRGVSRVAEWGGRRWIRVMGWTDQYVDSGLYDSEFSQIAESPIPPPEFLGKKEVAHPIPEVVVA